MMRAMYAAISGLQQHQLMLDVTANDIANVNTIGYKSSRVTFVDSLSQLVHAAAGASTASAGSNAAQIGLGVGLGSVDNLMTGGALQTTGNPLDVAIAGDGFFELGSGDPGGPIAPTGFTRAGNFAIDADGYLTTQDGLYVLGYASAAPEVAIRIAPDATGVAVDQSGGVSYVDASSGTRVTPYRLTLTLFPNPAGLERLGGNSWAQSANSGAPTVALPGEGSAGKTVAGTIEMSNVDLAQTFTNMIVAQRGFQANARVITTADEMLEELINLKR